MTTTFPALPLSVPKALPFSMPIDSAPCTVILGGKACTLDHKEKKSGGGRPICCQ